MKSIIAACGNDCSVCPRMLPKVTKYWQPLRIPSAISRIAGNVVPKRSLRSWKRLFLKNKRIWKKCGTRRGCDELVNLACLEKFNLRTQVIPDINEFL